MIHYALFSFEPTTILTIVASVLGAILLGALSLRGIIYNCPPNEVLIFTGRKRRVATGSWATESSKAGSVGASRCSKESIGWT
ncbi:MAG: hypothetical protein UZ18_ATM001000760 [Armatimonadetes bacterium OLB18]|nr:MAG: hypothetical protein UZ18_ATM001000760 [Armatimonadetes bacterium OLB18]